MTVTTEIHLARQPILARNNSLFGYQLIFRAGGGLDASGTLQHMGGSSIGALLTLELDRIAEGHPALVMVDRDALLSGQLESAGPEALIIGLHETVLPDDEVLAKCDVLKAMGYRIALGNYYHDETRTGLLAAADIVKMETLALTAGELEEQAALVKPYGVTLLAEQVESEDAYEDCLRMGFDLFQGFSYFTAKTGASRPDASQLSIMRILNLLTDPNTNDRKVEEAFRAEPRLSFNLLRMVNSAAIGGRNVESIGHAMRLIGRSAIHRWLALIMATQARGGGEVQLEVVKSALLRARLCELIRGLPGADAATLPGGESMFLVGLFSHMEVLMGQPMDTILTGVKLSDEVTGALLDRDGAAGRVLTAVAAYEEADWDRAEEELGVLEMGTDGLNEVFLDALAWAGEQLSNQQGD